MAVLTVFGCLAAVVMTVLNWQFLIVRQVTCNVLFADTNPVGPLGTVANCAP